LCHVYRFPYFRRFSQFAQLFLLPAGENLNLRLSRDRRVAGSRGHALRSVVGGGTGGTAVQITGAEGAIDLTAETDDGDVVIDSSGGAELTVSGAGISSGTGDVTLRSDDLEIEAGVSGGLVTLSADPTNKPGKVRRRPSASRCVSPIF